MADLYEINGVEVFSAGVWNGDEYTEQDLDAMVDAFNKTGTKIRPSLKLGHTDDQKLLQNDGLPSAGFVNKLYRKGQKLIADFVEIPKKIFDLIQNKAYSRVSSEIYWGIDIGNGETYDKLLSAVALLGSDIPAVSSLNEILALYGLNYESIKSYAKIENEVTLKQYSIEIPNHEEEQPMSENTETKVVIEKDEKLEEELKQYKNDLENLKKAQDDKEEELKKYKSMAEELEQKNREVQLERFLDTLEGKDLSSAGMRPYIKALLGVEKKEYSLQVEEEEVKLNSKEEILENILKLHSANSKVNFDDNSLEGDKGADKGEEIEKYAQEHKVSYAQAYKIIMKNKE